VLIVATSNLPGKDFSSKLDDLHPDEPRWFAMRVGYRKEKVVAKLLDREGVECFLPLRERPFRYKSKTGVRQIPLLGGYIFVRIVSRQVSSILGLHFVYGFVKIGRERRQIKLGEIDLLRRICSSNTLEWVVEDKAALLQPGCLVEICRGPLAGVRGEFINTKDKKTFVISFGGLDARLTTWEVSPQDIIPLRSDV
jgi:transcription antitermination factor NusG